MMCVCVGGCCCVVTVERVIREGLEMIMYGVCLEFISNSRILSDVGGVNT